MATEAQKLPLPPFPLSDLGPCELSCFSGTCNYDWKQWVFWSRSNDELLRYHQQRPLLFASNNGDPTMKYKIKCALQGFGHDFLYGAQLVQFWGIVNVGDNRYLTACDQPFALFEGRSIYEEAEGLCRVKVEGLCKYRKHCLEYLIAVDETSVAEGELGPPGRVFRSGSHERVVDVSYYSSKEYPQRDLAVQYVESYWALPVYQSPGHICIGVFEFLSSSAYSCIPWSKYQDSLKEVGLTINCPVRLPDYEESSSCHEKEINEIDEVLQVVRQTHQILVARLWIEANSKEQLTVLHQGDYDPCFIDTSCICLIRKGHGVVGKAFSSKSACFCKDITRLSITDNPFVPNARKYGLSSCFAICLQSSCSNRCIYTLEFVLSTNETCYKDPRTLLLMIIDLLKQHLQSSFKVASGQELGQNLVVEVMKVSSDDKLDSFEICHTSSGESTPRIIEVQTQVRMIPPDGSFQQVDTMNNSIHDINMQQNVIVGPPPAPKLVQNVLCITRQQPIEELDAASPARDDLSMEHNGSETTSSRRRDSAYTSESARRITLKDLQQRSAMKLVDAANDLGVSRSTLKRICRGHGILRWPSHKSRKYNQAIDQQEFAQSSKKNIEAHPMSVASAKRLLDDSSIIVKATYGDDTIKFQLLVSARKTDLEDEVAKGLNLPPGSFRIKFLDEDNDWISVTCDEHLNTSLRMLRSLGKTTVRMLVNR